MPYWPPRLTCDRPEFLTRALWISALALGCSTSACTEGAIRKGATIGTPAPAYAARSLAGDSASLAGLRGTVVLFNIWATWCHPCRAEIPQLQHLHELYAPQGFTVIGVSIDAGGMESGIKSFMRDFRMSYPVWLDPDENVSSQFLTLGVPSTFLIDRTGTIRWRKTGPISEGDAELTAAIARALVGPS